MARKSRKTEYICSEVQADRNPEVSIQNIVSFRAGLYARLSLESEANRERNTIENQMTLLKSFVAGKKDIEITREYFDISRTGTDFDRPGFSEMMQDIREGKINCVIVKDLSRLGRNYVDAGNYIERVFPFFNVRFIAVNDSYDSEKGNGGLMVGLSNIFNEHYSRDISRKIKSSERSSWKKGECVSASLAYGLMRDPQDKHRIVPDPEVSDNVVKIFNVFVECGSYAEVARAMTNDCIICPKAYFALKRTGEIPEGMDVSWISTSVREILKNRYYIGDSVHGKVERFKFREKKREIRPKEEWIIVENTHEAIISKELFEKAQGIIAGIKSRYEESRKNGEQSVAHLNLLKDYIYCADCGRKMYLIKQKGIRPQYYCSGAGGYRRYCKKGHYIMLEDVENAVMKVIHSHIVTCLDSIEMMRRINRRQESMIAFDGITKEINRLSAELKKLKKHRQDLYDDYSSHLIDIEQYREYVDTDRQAESSLMKRLSELTDYQKSYDKNYHVNEEWSKIIELYKNKRKLTREIVEAFVERVEVHEDKTLEVRLKYDDILKDIVDITKKRGAGNG
ncbi:MAG: recombinase family protein [Eubacterium sp.]|nr:recombinase family protein [Eubacterium sp.]